jgi:sugar fermentation stimulation protein A
VREENMRFEFTVMKAAFIARPNRYVVHARLEDGSVVRAHCADPGRLRELLVPGATLYLSPANAPERRTQYDLRFVEAQSDGTLVSLDTSLPNKVVALGLARQFFPQFGGEYSVRGEVFMPCESAGSVRSRADFMVEGPDVGRCWIEVKSVTLVESGIARFPDAPTERGRRHVHELTEIVRRGIDRAAVLFVAQRPDAVELRPNWDTDRAFAEALITASAAGVEVSAYTCALTLQGITLKSRIPVALD